jgi:hypothetical protein
MLIKRNGPQSPSEIDRLVRVWPRLSPRVRAGILVLAGIREFPPAAAERRPHAFTRRGETPAWLLPAMNLLKDTNGNLPDREIARRMGIAHSTLLRNQAYLRAREAFHRPQAEAGRHDPSKSLLRYRTKKKN